MTTDRRFCRLSSGPAARSFGMPEVPRDGMCLCVFLVVHDAERPSRVLMGKLDPSAPWDHLGALDEDRVRAWKDLWMLPSSHLIFLEGPAEAASRVLRELTPLSPRPLQGPQVTSEVYAPRRHPEARRHWDLEFVFRTEAHPSELRPLGAWRELTFVETRTLRPQEMARSQEDILTAAGYALAESGR